MPLASCPVLGGAVLLATWESAAAQHPLDRALTILRAAYPRRSRDELARLPIGERDALLFAFHAAHFGPQIEGQAHCPQCTGHIEVSLDLRELPLGEQEPPDVLQVEADGYTVQCRLPDSYDAAAIAAAAEHPFRNRAGPQPGAAGGSTPDNASRSSAEPLDARRLLLERILVAVEQASPHGDTPPTGDPALDEVLPEHVRVAVARALEAAQPLADPQLLVTCPTCGHAWSLVLDIVDFVWARLEALVLRLLAEVDALARAYGWREADILALSPARRQAYLGMVAG